MLPKKIKIVEVGPRDGLQNEKKIVSTADKIIFVQKLIDSGLKTIEVGSFVAPHKIPQMDDSAEVLKAVKGNKGITFPTLVPNLYGLERAIKAGAKEISVFTATSETFNKKNINATIDESLIRIKEITKTAKKIKVRGYISTVFGCPYEGKTSIKTLIKVMKNLFSQGIYEISLGDTIGIANPAQVKKVIKEISKNFDLKKIAMHFHDTRGMALANALKSLEMGITTFDSSAGGIGGCPYAKGATGNVSTEDMVNMFESMGIKTGVDLNKLVEASDFISKVLGRELPSKVLKVHLMNS
ncbi:MAG: hydroxymethylglutaryl-CoA lyase [Bacteriovoracales bacterium]